jgi:hypothetical protein
LGTVKGILLGLCAVLGTGVLALAAEVIWGYHQIKTHDPGMQLRGGEIGIDFVTMIRNSSFTPAGIVAGIVIFALAATLAMRHK